MKKKFLYLFILLVLFTIVGFQYSPYARRVYPVTTDPTCSENQIWYNMTTHLAKICTNAGPQTIVTGSAGSPIGGAVTGGTTGSVLFVGSGPILAQDNANFFYDPTQHQLGLGTTVPSTTGTQTGATGPVLSLVNSVAGGRIGITGNGAGQLVLYDSSATSNQRWGELISNSNTLRLINRSDNSGSIINNFLKGDMSNGKISFGPSLNGATQIATLQTTIPTCATNCGTSPTIIGSDVNMSVTMGATGSPASGFIITFNGTWLAAPICTVQSALSSMVALKMPIAVVSTTTTLTITTNGAAPANSDKYNIICLGTQ